MSQKLNLDSAALRRGFSSLQSSRDIADLLEVKFGLLIYHLYKADPSTRYKLFEIPKKSGGTRQISSPSASIKFIQKKLNQVLQEVYPDKDQVHGFARRKSILSNARCHTQRRFVLNVDLADFFRSINFGRVRGMFMAFPYFRNPEVATVLAKICCFNNELPQGAPTSPIVSNMVCAKFDSQLFYLAEKVGCVYSRYADDLTFSTSEDHLPDNMATLNCTGLARIVTLGTDLRAIIERNGFRINEKKVRLQRFDTRQVVTGLVTNQVPNVKRDFTRQIRAMIHAWRKFGLEAAEEHFHNRYLARHRRAGRARPSFKKVLHGKIEFFGSIRGFSNPSYIRFRQELRQLAPDLVKGADLVPEAVSSTRNSFYFRQDGINLSQLTYEIEDEVGVRLIPYQEGDTIEGHLEKRSNGVALFLCTQDKASDQKSPYGLRKKILTLEEELILRETIQQHVKQPLIYQGHLALAVTRHISSIGRVVVTDQDQQENFATAFLFKRRNLALTAAHVVDPTRLTIKFVEFGTSEVACEIVHSDPRLDLAVLRLHQDIPAAPIRIRHPLLMPKDRGMKCAAIGFPNMPGYTPYADIKELALTGVTEHYVSRRNLVTLSIQ